MESKARDPLKPTKAPEEPWSRLYTDHCGPTQDGQHILVVTDGLTRYPEVVLVAIVAWMQKGSTTVKRNILLVLNRSTFQEWNLALAEPWCHSSLLLLC